MNMLGVILADVGDIIMFLVFIVIAVLGALGQLATKMQEGKQKRRQAGLPRRPPPQPGRAGAGQAQVGRPPAGQGPLKKEIDDFLRRAAQGRPAGPVRRPQPTAPEQPVDVELVEVADEQSVATHVQKTVGQQRLGRLSQGPTGRQVEQTDAQLQQHVQQVFGHRLGRLGSTPGESAQPTDAQDDELPATAAAGLAAMLADPGNLRQAILLSEILQRPEHRWR